LLKLIPAEIRSLNIAESVFHKNPRHPGAVHYMIHAYDDPKHAIRALPAARIYGSLASAAPHAQHMPSHIFMALGMWPEVVQANELSWASSEERIRRKGLGPENRAYHTLYWLMYGYLQQGRYEKAKGLLEIVESDSRTLGSNHIKDVRASMRATYIVEARAWNVQGIEEDRSVLRFPAAVSSLFAIGLSGVHLNDLSTAQQALALIRECVDQLPNTDPPSSPVMAGRVMVKELEGLIEIVAGRRDQGLSILKEAVVLQDAVPYEYGPPFPVKPSHELLGEALLKAGRFQEAEKHFKAALDQAPERALSLRGLSQIPR